MRDTPTAPGAYVEVAGAPLYYEDAGDGPVGASLCGGWTSTRCTAKAPWVGRPQTV